MKKTIKQHDRSDCGAACLASIAGHYRLGLPIARVRQLANTSQKGTNLLCLINAANQLGFTAQGVRADEEALSEVSLPAIAHVVLNETSHHYIVVYAVKKRSIRCMDPATGRMKNWPKKEFMAAWSGVLLLVAPGNDFQIADHRISIAQRCFQLVKPHRSTLIQALFGAVIYTILGLSTAVFLQKITDFVLVSGNGQMLNLLSLGMLAILALALYLGAMKSVLVLRSGQLIDANLILGYYKHLLKLPQRFFDNMRTGEIISRVGDAIKIRSFINDVAINLLVNIFIIVFSFCLMFTYYWKLAMALLVIIPLYACIYGISNYLNRKRERVLMERAADLESQLVESVNNIRTIKQLNIEAHANQQTEQRFVSMLDATYHSGLNAIFTSVTSEGISRLFTILLLWAGAHLVIGGKITTGELFGFYALVGYFTGPARSLIGMNRKIQHALIAADRLFEIVDLVTEDGEETNIAMTPELLGNINFHNVHFAYEPGREVFQGLDLKLPVGQVTAVVGESGSGKSTIASLVQKLYPPNAGQITLGSIDLKHIDHSSLRRHIGVVPQQVDLFAGNILENIALGDPIPDLKKVIDICKELGLLTFIEKLPKGFQTYVGENGMSLSGGQRQRVALARALYQDPSLIILDEATAALDAVSEQFVQQAVQRLRNEGKTILVIAHRLSTIMDADQILVMENGKVVESGNHHELLEQGGKYEQLWLRQFPPMVQRKLVG